jgi:type IV pilus assembly protein PilY1
MLHGFDNATGQEKLAYVPFIVFSNLNKLTDRDYAHRYFVDGPPVSGDVYGIFTNVSGVCSTGCWRTVLTGGLGAGGKGIFALDITDPDGTTISDLAFNEANAAKIALWEYTDASSGDMGYVFGQPNIVRVRNGTNTTAWAVVFGNGYNSTNENAALYVVNAVTGALIRKIVLNPLYTGWRDTANTNGNPPNSNGLSMPAMIDTNGDYIVDYAYAGDLRGNLWKVDLTSDNPSSWDSAYKSGSTAKPLFQTVDGTTATTVEQPITTRPEVGNHPDNLGGYMIYFGTGRYIATAPTADNAANTSPVHTFYGVWDKSYSGSGTPVVRADLLPQTISSATVGSRSVRGLTNTTMQWRTGASGTCQSDGTGNCLGCRVDLLTAQAGSLGEKQVTNSLLLSGTVPKVLFNTLIPETHACTAGGRGLEMVINPKNCGRPAEQVFDVDGDGEITSADMINGTTPVAGVDPGIGILSEPTVIRDSATGTDISRESGSSGDISTERLGGGVKGGRQSWRQLR